MAGSAPGRLLIGRVPTLEFDVAEGTLDPDVTEIAAPVVIHHETWAVMSALAPSYRISPESTFRIGRALADATAEFRQTAHTSSDAV